MTFGFDVYREKGKWPRDFLKLLVRNNLTDACLIEMTDRSSPQTDNTHTKGRTDSSVGVQRHKQNRTEQKQSKNRKDRRF